MSMLNYTEIVENAALCIVKGQRRSISAPPSSLDKVLKKLFIPPALTLVIAESSFALLFIDIVTE